MPRITNLRGIQTRKLRILQKVEWNEAGFLTVDAHEAAWRPQLTESQWPREWSDDFGFNRSFRGIVSYVTVIKNLILFFAEKGSKDRLFICPFGEKLNCKI